MKFNENYIAVGTTANEDGTKEGVVVVCGGLGKFTMDEGMSRKLADDILRNANYLWPVPEEKTQ